MVFNDWQLKYDPKSDLMDCNGWLVPFDHLWEHLRRIQIKRLKAHAPPPIQDLSLMPEAICTT